jgi:UDP-N-acetyl-D-glucosamine dehydrogenase
MKCNKKVSIVGLGFIGLPLYAKLVHRFNSCNVFGIDKQSKLIKEKFKQLQSGINPIKSNDRLFDKIIKKNSINKLNLKTDLSCISKSNIIVISVGFDLTKLNSMQSIKKIFAKILHKVKENTLIILETTILPGTSEKIILPLIDKICKKRKICPKKIFFSYSFERIMPGKNYIKSLSNHRCYSSKDDNSKKKTEDFFKNFLNIKSKNLFFLNSMTECETTKIIENTYRALNIAFIDEWTNFCIERNLNLNKILEAIRIRETHRNIMKPGLGVGGYCLTKDLIFGSMSNSYFKFKKINFPLTFRAKKINEKMVKTSFFFLKKNVFIANKKILILGASYKEDVFDLRLSPVIDLYKLLKKYTTKIQIFDPLSRGNEGYKIVKKMPKFINFDIIIFANGHEQIKNINLKKFNKKPFYFDLNNIISKEKIVFLKKKGFRIKVLGDKE